MVRKHVGQRLVWVKLRIVSMDCNNAMHVMAHIVVDKVLDAPPVTRRELHDLPL